MAARTYLSVALTLACVGACMAQNCQFTSNLGVSSCDVSHAYISTLKGSSNPIDQ